MYSSCCDKYIATTWSFSEWKQAVMSAIGKKGNDLSTKNQIKVQTH